ncbi:FG-GAP-like repeat-containing protein [Streptomyces sp. NPDC008121]|uniref:FG-GAP-like repeat-containing protein n=1 Tax=Streptomyces sp. NPDC008121 TaxID=3364809 RepID=UPI0036E95482
MRTSGLFKALLATLAFLCAATLPTAPPARADTVTPSAAPPVRTYTYNICGSGGTTGCLVTAAENKARVDTIVAETGGAWNADYIFLVEVCRYQYDDLNAALKPRGYTGRYVQTVAQSALKGSNGRQLCVDTGGSTTPSYGMALFVRGYHVEGADLTLDTKAAIQDTVDAVAIGPVGAEDIKAPCIKAWVQNRLTWSCSVHLWWGTPNAPVRPTPPAPPATPEQTAKYNADLATYKDRAARHQVMVREAKVLTDKAREWEDAGIPVILGGDFNSSPWGDVLNGFYAAPTGDGAHGGFIEADETDISRTAGFGNCQTPGITRCRMGALTMFDAAHQNRVQKLDYTFFGSRFFRGAVGDVPAEPTTPTGQWISDHLPLRAAAYWSDCGPYGDTPGAVHRRDAAGGLYRYEGRANGDSAALAKPCKVGSGWTGMKHVARHGTTLAAVDAAGNLWHYPAAAVDGSYSGGTRRLAGTGFQDDTLLLAPGDFDGDGTADLITRDTTGGLWLHHGTGPDGYAPRTPLAATSGDWVMYPSVIAGDFAHSEGTDPGTPDLIAIDEVGSLWLQEGTGDGTLTERRQIGHGWGVYDTLAAPGDLNGDGKPDMAAREAGGDLYYYKGDGAGGYAPRVKIGSSFPAGELLF